MGQNRTAGNAGPGLGLLFEGATIATFAFYFVVDAPRLRRLVLTMLPPARQQVVGWAWDTAIQRRSPAVPSGARSARSWLCPSPR